MKVVIRTFVEVVVNFVIVNVTPFILLHFLQQSSSQIFQEF